MNTEILRLSASFRVIGVGPGIEEIINKVNSIGLDGVSAEIIESPYNCAPRDGDKLAIIVFADLEDAANRIANTFHDAGVLTIGVCNDAYRSCYDSVMEYVSTADIPEIIKTLLQPIGMPGLISYDFNDLSTILRDSKYFTGKSTLGNDVKEATEKMHVVFDEMDMDRVDYLSINLYFNPDRSLPIKMIDTVYLSELISTLPESINIIWSVNHDAKLKDKEVRLSAIFAGKEAWKCSIK